MAFMVLIHHGRLDITANPKVNYRLPESMPNHHPYWWWPQGHPTLVFKLWQEMHTKNRQKPGRKITFRIQWSNGFCRIGSCNMMFQSYPYPHHGNLTMKYNPKRGHDWIFRETFVLEHQNPSLEMENKHMHPATKSCISFCYH